MVSSILLLSALCSTLVSALPTPDTGVHHLFRRESSAADIIGQIMPKSLSCSGADFPDQCATNVQAATPFINAMVKYGLTNAAEIAGVLALVAVESGELRYRHSEFPTPTPGKGTSNMQSPDFNKQYAESIDALKSAVAAANGDADAILSLVMTDDYNFGSGAWFLATQCTDSDRAALRTNTDDGFKTYMKCVGAPMTSARLDYWHTAQKAFGLA